MKSIALVTGAGRREDLGFEVSRQLGEKGWHVILTSRDLAAAADRAAELSAEGMDVTGRALDVNRLESIQWVAAEIEIEFGRLDVLINNAATLPPAGELASTADLEAARIAVDTVLFGSWRMRQVFLPLLRRSHQPRIVNVSSATASYGDRTVGLLTENARDTGHAVALAALNALTVRLARSEAATGVLVNAVCPGPALRPVADAAASVLWAALLEDEGSTGGFFRDGRSLPW